MIQVAIIDDHPVARRGLTSILSDAGDIAVTMSVGSPAELATAESSGQPREQLVADVVLLDLYLSSDEPCLPVIAQLATATKVLVVSASGRPADVLGAIRAGASGYITKLVEADMLLSAVRTVASGGFALSSQLADILQAELVRRDRPTRDTGPGAAVGVDGLSPREEQTLDLIARGFTHAQTATRMGISKATIDTYVERIRAKLQVGNKAELTRAALQRISASENR